MTQPKIDERSKEALTVREKALAENAELKAEMAAIKAELEATKSARTDSQRADASTVRRDEKIKLKDGPQLNMEVWGEIPGYHMYIAVDQDGEIERHLHLGYGFVEFGEVPTNASQKTGASADNRISWHSGTDEGGNPYRSYLMKIELGRWEETNNARNEANAEETARLMNGVLENGDGRYVPQRGINLQH